MDHHNTEAYADGASNGLLQYSQTYNPSDNFYTHAHDHGDPSWNVNATTFPQSNLSRAAYQNGEWTAHQDVQRQRDNFSHSPAPGGAGYPANSSYNNFGNNTFAYASHPHQPQQQQQQQHHDPSLLSHTPQAFRQMQSSTLNYSNDSGKTIEPQILDNSIQQRQFSTQKPQQLHDVSGSASVDFAALAKTVPKSVSNGTFHIIDYDQLISATNSERMAAFATIAKEPVSWDLNRTALPSYTPRSSKNDLKRAAGDDGTLLAKINARSFKKARIGKVRAPRPMKSAGDVAGSRMVDLDNSSESSDSEYTTDEDVEETPLPAKRPELPKEAMEYDTIQALWRSRRTNLDASNIRKGLVDFWDLVKTFRDRWKSDAQAVTTAEEKGAKGELPMLRQRVKDSRDMIEVAFRAALHHGNRTIVQTFSENTSLLFLSYQFLLDRFKANDVNGSLAKTLLEVLSLSTTITSEKLEKTYLVKVLPRYVKNGDVKTQHLAKTILSKATAVKTEPGKGDVASGADSKSPTTTAGVKRASTDSDTGSVAKRPATANVTVKKPAADATSALKKAAPLNSTATKSTPADVSKPAAKPAASKLTSGLFAGLQSAAKKPGTSMKTGTTVPTAKPAATPAVKPVAAPVQASAPTQKSVFSFADTMRSLAQPKEDKPAPKPVEKEIPNETPEQKARRLRREARGPLRVHWKNADELVAIREFTHDPEEETGHDSSQVRDVADLKGEGRMFKQQHNKMDFDDDEDEVEIKMIDWSEPVAVDFSDVPKEERDRNYSPYGGGQLVVDSAENIERKKYEDNTLSVFYSHSDDIPLTPRDPEQPINGEQGSVTTFGPVKQELVDRGARLRASRQPAPAAVAPIDFMALRNALSMQPGNAFQPAALPAPPPGMPDIGAIIAQLNQNKPPAQPAPPAPPAPFAPQLAGLFPQAATPQPAPPANGAPDIAAILAQLNGGGKTAAPAPPVPAAAAAPSPFPFPPPVGFPPPPGMADPGFMAFLAQHAAMQAQQPPSSGGLYENPDRKRMRDA